MNDRICFWTTYVQQHLIVEVCNHLGISRSAACELLIRRALQDMMDEPTRLADSLQTRLRGLRQDHPLSYAQDLARRTVDEGLAPKIVDDIPY